MKKYQTREVDGFAGGTLAYMRFYQGPTEARRGQIRLDIYDWDDTDRAHKSDKFFVMNRSSLIKVAIAALGAAGEDKLVDHIMASGRVEHAVYKTTADKES